MKKVTLIQHSVLRSSFALLMICATAQAAPVVSVPFHAGTGIHSEDQTEAMVLGDIDADDDIDVIKANGSGGVIRHLNDGHGGFTVGDRVGSDFNQALSVALGDVDADGDLDLLVGRVSQPIRLYLNDGHGDFGAQGIEFSAEQVYARSLALVDVDADGDLDLAAGGQNVAIKLFRNDGNGRFGAASQDIGSETAITMAMAFADVDGDSDVDLLAVNSGEPVRRYLNDGQGNFSAKGDEIAPPRYQHSGLLGDVDGDGDVDMFTAGIGENELFINDGHGVFTVKASGVTNQAEGTYSLALGDVDGDGDLDLLAGNYRAPNELYLNDGKGYFSSAGSLGAAGEWNCCVALADLDGDHDLDVISVSAAGQDGKTYLNDSGKAPQTVLKNLLAVTPKPAAANSAVVAKPATEPVFLAGMLLTSDGHAERMAVADIDNDGDTDVVVSRKIEAQSFLTFYRNNGSGELAQTSEIIATVADAASSLLFADVDGDSKVDLLVGHYQQFNTLHHNNGDGSFAAAGVKIGLNAGWTNDMIASDIDGDGDLDLIAANRGKSKRYLNDGSGHFGSGRAINREAKASHSIIAMDVDGDNDADLILGNDSDGIALYENKGDGTFKADGDMMFKNSASNWQLSAADLDGDGDIDLFAGGTSMLTLLNDGQGHFAAGHELNGARNYALADVDLDGDADLITGDYSLPIKLQLNDGHAGWLPVSNPIDSTNASAFVLADMDGDGDRDLLVLPTEKTGLMVYANSTYSGPIDERITRKFSEEKRAATPVATGVILAAPDTVWGQWWSAFGKFNERYNISGMGLALLLPLLLYFLLRRKNN